MNFSVLEDVLFVYRRRGGECKAILQRLEGREEERKRDHWRSYSFLNIESDYIPPEDLDKLVEYYQLKPEFLDEPDKRRSLRVVKTLAGLQRNPGKRLVNLEVMAGALKEFFRPLPNHWVFIEQGGNLFPWHVGEIQYHPPTNHRDSYTPAHVTVELCAKCRGVKAEDTKTIWREMLRTGCTPETLCEWLGWFVETEELRKQYEEEMVAYRDYSEERGEQFLAVGRGKLGYDDEDEDRDNYWSRWHRGELTFEREGIPSRVIMDDSVQYGSKGQDQAVYVPSYLWAKASSKEDEEEIAEKGNPIPAPVHPCVCVFSLTTHEFAVTHISNLTPYEYNPALADKLVLPKDHRKLINILIGSAANISEDIIQGKSGGVVILCSGAPGTGKTLTAEIYAEVARRPLYTVQCSQLGVDAEELEKELGRVLRRAVKWHAILLIDEADVYIHERGTNMAQNAVVGVFLRLLEYYSGVLFLTTNRETVVDDAIRSRCMAHVRYALPDNDEDRRNLWRILSDQYHIKLKPEVIQELIRLFPSISGRTVKQFCRLAQALGKGEQPGIELFTWLAQFQPHEVAENEAGH